jgi:hypothetical protein
MATDWRRVHRERMQHEPRNWVLLGLVGMSLEFWIVVTTVFADRL